MENTTDVKTTYDQVAEEYVKRIFDELKDKPLDRKLLDGFAERLRGRGPVCDIGCGPGHVARYLHERGVEMTGLDLSQGMVDQARRLNPGIGFRQGDMMCLDVPDGAWAGIVAFYSIIHVPRDKVVSALKELHRTLRSGGLLFLAFHLGTETLHRDEWWGQRVSIDFLFFEPGEMKGHLRTAGFEIEDVVEREPYPEVEHPSRRAYILARVAKPGPRNGAGL